MPHNNHVNNEKNNSESVIVDSVRAQIMKYLRDGCSKRFKEITKDLDRHDYVIKRELDILIKRGWIIKTGKGYTSRYCLNTKKKNVLDFLDRLDATPNTNSHLYPIDLSTEVLANVLGDAPSIQSLINEIKNKQDFIEILKKPENLELIIKRAIVNALPRIKITIASDKINYFDQYIKKLEEQPDEIAGIIRFTEYVRNIRNMAIMENCVDLGEKASDEDFQKMFEEIKNQKFQIIISCEPDKK